MKKVIICGYPKSGNTWLTRLCATIINCNVTGFWEDPNVTEFAALVNEDNHINKSDWECYKSHTDALSLIKNQSITEHDKVIYILRDPRDVAVSAYHYFTIPCRNKKVRFYLKKIPFGLRLYNKFYDNDKYSINRVVKWILNGTHEAPCLDIPWKEHVLNSLKVKNKILIVKYEDLLSSTSKEVGNICNYLGINRTRKEINTAADKEIFFKVKRNFIKAGQYNRAGFMRKGVAGDWKNFLNKKSLLLIEKNCKELMGKFDYL